MGVKVDTGGLTRNITTTRIDRAGVVRFAVTKYEIGPICSRQVSQSGVQRAALLPRGSFKSPSLLHASKFAIRCHPNIINPSRC